MKDQISSVPSKKMNYFLSSVSGKRATFCIINETAFSLCGDKRGKQA